MRTTQISWALAFALVLALSGTTRAREVLREPFEGGTLPGRDGPGWSQVDPQHPMERALIVAEAKRGAVSFDVQRRSRADAGVREAIFEIRGKDQRLLIGLSVVWTSAVDKRSILILEVPPLLQKKGERLAYARPAIPLGREVAPGQWVHIDLIWDDGGGKMDFYADGARLTPAPGGTADPRDVSPAPEMGGTLRAPRGRNSPAPSTSSQLIGDRLPKAATLRWGNELHASSGSKPSQRSWRPPVSAQPLSHAVLDNFVVVVDEPLEELSTAKHDVKDLKATFVNAGVELAWAPPEIHGIDQQYLVYRRTGAAGKASFERLTRAPVRDLRFFDATALESQTYRYSVTSVYGDLNGGILEGKYPPEVTVTAARLAVASVAAEQGLYGAGQEVVVTLRGTADKVATFTLEGVATDVAMAEVDDGVYVGKVKAPPGLNVAKAALTGRLGDLGAAGAATLAGPPVGFDATAPDPVPGIVISVPWAGEIEVSWQPSPSRDVDHYIVCRAAGAATLSAAASCQTTRELTFTDRAVIPGLAYRYAVAAVDRAGNSSALGQAVSAQAVAGDGPRVSGVTIAPFGKPIRPGETVTVTLAGASGGRATVDLGALGFGLTLTEQGRTGAYTGSYTLKAEDVGPTLARVPTVVHLADDFGASVAAGPELSIVGQDGLNDHTPPVLTAVSHDGFRVAGLRGALVAGDVVTVTAQGEPGGTAWFDIGGVAGNRPMVEAAGSGTYSGTYTVRFGDVGDEAAVTVHLADEAGNETTLGADKRLAFDTRVRLTVQAADRLLPADRTSRTRLTAKAVDANATALAGHELALTLSTTEEYTGVVGGGALAGRWASIDDVDDVEVKWGGVTDNFGEVTADYTAGFAAKTALVIAKDLTTGDVGAGWLNTYVASTVAIELTPRAKKGVEDSAVLRMEADPAKLTADGRSTSRIKVWLTDLAGNAVVGASVSFSLGNANGRLKALRATTDGKGLAEAEYRAGTSIGTVTVTATAAAYGVTGNVQITLMSDAPAKVDLVASAAKLVANGSDTATLSVVVTDIHDNPNHEVPVTFAVLKGGGRLSAASLLTDRNGAGAVTYTAGNQPGVATIEARHTSREPTEGELRRVYGTLFVPRWFERQERDRLSVREWLVKPGEVVARGQTLAVLATRRGEWTVAAPAKGVFVREVRHERDLVELGETLGYVEIDPEAWKTYGVR